MSTTEEVLMEALVFDYAYFVAYCDFVALTQSYVDSVSDADPQ